MSDNLPELTMRDRLDLWWLGFRRRWRRCPECGRRGYGTPGPGPGRWYRWVDDPIVRACGFETAPHRCNTCGQKPAKPVEREAVVAAGMEAEHG